MDNISQTSRGTAYTSRAISLLEKVRQVCDANQIHEFHRSLAAFKRKEIDATETHERVSKVLANYPALLEEFAFYIPVEKEEEKETLTSNFNFAMTFVQQVRASYADRPEVYNTFLLLLKDYQMEKVTPTQVVLLVSDLLKETPDLVSQFKASYGRGIMNHNEGKLEMNRATSNDTIVQNRPDQHEDCLNLSEVQPLLEQDPESGTCAPSTHSFYKKLFVSFLVLSLVLAFISASAIYFDWISLLK